MAIEADIRTYLLTQPGITGLLEDRIRPDLLSEHDADPAIVIAVEDEDDLQDLSGESTLVRADLRINCISRSKSGARALAEQCRQALQGYTGPAGDLSKIDVTLDGRGIERFQASEGSNEGEYVVEQRCTVLYPQSAVTF